MARHDMNPEIHETHSRLVIVEHNVGELSKAFSSLRAEVKDSLNAVLSEMRKMGDEQAKSPKAHSFRDIAMTVGITISIMTGVLTGLSQYYKLLGSVDAYRLEQIEKKINPNVQFVRPVP